MAWDTDKILEDLKTGIGLTPPGAAGKGILGIAGKIRGNEAEIRKVIRELLKRTLPGQAAEVVKLVIDRYQLDPDVAQRMVANEMSDANIPTDPSGTADEGYTERGLGPDAGAEDYYLEKETGGISLEDYIEAIKEGKIERKSIPLPEPERRPNPIDDSYDPKRRLPGPLTDGDGERRKVTPWPKLLPEYRREPFNLWGPPTEYRREPFRPGEELDFEYALNKGGRVGYQSGGVTETRQLPPEYIEALGKTYAADLTRQAGIPSITTATAQQPGETAPQFQQRQAQAQQYGITKAGMADHAPQVAAQDPYQAAAYAQAVDPTTGLGGYQPYLQAAGTAATTAGGLTGPMTGAQLATIDPTTGQTVTPTLAPGSYMSPYQQQVIDTTMADYDAQAAKSRLGLGAQAVAGGAYGAGRHGIAEAEFDALSNRGRSAQLANLRATGFQQAQQSRQQDLANQMGLVNLQTGLGQTAQDFGRAQIAGLGTLGAGQQAQNQAVLDAQRQFATMAVQEPIQRSQMLGSGVVGLMGGMADYGTRIGEAPETAQSSPLASALGIGLMGADIYGRIFGNKS